MKRSFIMYCDWSDMIDELTESERGELLLAIMHYQTGQDVPELSPCVRVAFAQIKSQFKRDSDKYDETVEKRKEAGRAGGLAKASNSKQKLANASKSKQSLANLADNDNGNDNNIIKESTLKGTKEKQFKPPTVDEVKEYCEQHGYKIDAEKFVDFYESKGWMVGKNKMKDWKAAVRNWCRSDSPRQEKAAKAKKTDFEQRNYDYADLNKRLFGGE